MMQKVMCQKTARHVDRLLSKFNMAAAIILDFTNLLPFHYYSSDFHQIFQVYTSSYGQEML
jgi:hypothetical protein